MSKEESLNETDDEKFVARLVSLASAGDSTARNQLLNHYRSRLRSMLAYRMDARLAAYATRPSILKQIKQHLKKKFGIKTYLIGDSFRGRNYIPEFGANREHEENASNTDTLQDKKYFTDKDASPESNPLIEFWKLLPGKNSRIQQWYLMDMIMSKNIAIVGNRSGAFLGLEYLGMNVINLEDRYLFSRRREGQFIGRLKNYFRLTTSKPIGYKNLDPKSESVYTELQIKEYLQRMKKTSKNILTTFSKIKEKLKEAHAVFKNGEHMNDYEISILESMIKKCMLYRKKAPFKADETDSKHLNRIRKKDFGKNKFTAPPRM